MNFYRLYAYFRKRGFTLVNAWRATRARVSH